MHTTHENHRTTDSSGFEIFSDGALGAAHVAAHAALDAGSPQPGHRALASFLQRRRPGAGPRWVHLHWHMLVFELVQEQPGRALSRFQEHILPAIERGEDALLDGPSALWHLRLTFGQPLRLPWKPAYRRAVAGLWRQRVGPARPDPFLALHHLMAVAGAGDLELLDSWLSDPANAPATEREHVLHAAVRGLRALAGGEPEGAAAELERALPGLHQLGGSRAQRTLFERMWAAASDARPQEELGGGLRAGDRPGSEALWARELRAAPL